MVKPTVTLECTSCAGTRFYQMFNIKMLGTGGTNPTMIGYRCADCGADVDIALLIQKYERKRKMAELRQLQDEIGPEPVMEKKELAKTSK